MGEHNEVAIGGAQRLDILIDLMGFRPKATHGQMIAPLTPSLFGARAGHHVDGLEARSILGAVAIGIDDPLILLPILVRIDKADLQRMRQVNELLAADIVEGIARRYVQYRHALRNIAHYGVLAIANAVARTRMGGDVAQRLDDGAAFDDAIKSPFRLPILRLRLTGLRPCADCGQIDALIADQPRVAAPAQHVAIGPGRIAGQLPGPSRAAPHLQIGARKAANLLQLVVDLLIGFETQRNHRKAGHRDGRLVGNGAQRRERDGVDQPWVGGIRRGSAQTDFVLSGLRRVETPAPPNRRGRGIDNRNLAGSFKACIASSFPGDRQPGYGADFAVFRIEFHRGVGTPALIVEKGKPPIEGEVEIDLSRIGPRGDGAPAARGGQRNGECVLLYTLCVEGDRLIARPALTDLDLCAIKGRERR